MKNETKASSRRNFMKKSAQLSVATAGILAVPQLSCFSQTSPPPPPPTTTNNDSINFVGPKEGYTPQIGTLVSMMNWMRNTILQPVRGMSVKDLDFLLDDNSNSIGAMLWHLASTEKFYQINTFDGKRWGDWSDEDSENWSVAMSLGNNGRAQIKGNSLDFYLEKLETVRENTLKELKNRDDEWLLKVDPDWMWSSPTNNYCKWFHVVEHESNHNGQIKYIASRIK